jgi:hypothetical protein
MTNTQQQYDAFVRELQECVAGNRGWVNCSKQRATVMGLAHSNLVVAARSLGLEVEAHGKHGYCARKVAA